MATSSPAAEARALREVDESDVVALWNDLERLEALMLEMADDVRWIEQQLGDRDRSTADGERLAGEEYWRWRNRAVAARAHKLSLYRRLKARSKELRMADHERRLAGAAARGAERRAEHEARQATLDGRLDRLEEKIDRILSLMEPAAR